MIFIWRGWGILVVVYAFVAFVVGTIIGNSVGAGIRAGVAVGVCEVIAGIAVWFTGIRLNRGGDRMLIDPKTGTEVRVRRSHTLFWIRMEYWAPVLAIAGIIVVIAALAR
jgi:hypothetical protein